jgi:hypothetical protein
LLKPSPKLHASAPPDAYDRNSRKGDFHSYRLHLGKNLGAKLRWQVAGGQKFDGNAQQIFQFDLQTAEVEQRRTGQGVNQQVEVTAVLIGAVEDRTEAAGVGRAKAASRLGYGNAVASKAMEGFMAALRWQDAVL